MTVIMLSMVRGFSQDNQIVIRGTVPISRSATPRQVIDSLNRTFPDARSVHYYKVPADAVERGWQVTKEDNLTPGKSLDYYTISFNKGNTKYYSLFASDGRLIRSKLEQPVTSLPPAVRFSIHSLGKQYPGYRVISKTFLKTINRRSEDELYEVVAQKGKDQKRLFYTRDGRLMNIK
jgi:hypothetical protein